MCYNSYQEYLRSDEWKKKRDRIIERDGFCLICSSTKKLRVHHNTYDRCDWINGECNELQKDLITICDQCHKKFHNKPRKPKRTKKTELELLEESRLQKKIRDTLQLWESQESQSDSKIGWGMIRNPSKPMFGRRE